MEHGQSNFLPSTRTGVEPISALTHREVEILKWCAAGKTAAETGTILNLKCRTVNYHMSSVIRKMGVSNKTSAAVQGALSGIF
ncbi:MAG TPA: helix-turn-helix transcriptional regulator [Pseudomonas sp.]|uniref:helix-turn-helix domain-containing protein n=1 Tax=Pseudomonas sp. TaxID=306 RepID=UPI002ED9C789